MERFKEYHPIVQFIYFFSVLLFAMFLWHPYYMSISISAAFIYSVMLNGKKALKFNIVYMIPSLIFVASINPLFNHEGVTILFYLKSGNPFTLESVVFGIVSATMLITVIMWFSCYNALMTSDKFMYLFGRIIPATSLIFSMTLRFVPLYKERVKIISNAQKCIGNDVTQGSFFSRVKNGIKILSVMTTWSLENSIETADSMKARGYGLKGRTAFSHYKRTSKDNLAITVLILTTTFVLVGMAFEYVEVQYFPWVSYTPLTFKSSIFLISYILLCYMPIGLTAYDEYKWWKRNNY